MANSSFERGLEDISGNLTDWYIGNDVWGRVGYVPAKNGNGALYWPPFPAAAGSVYTITGDSLLLASSGQTRFDIEWRNSAGEVVYPYTGGAAIVGAHGFSSDDSNRLAHAGAGAAPAGAVVGYPRFVWESVAGATLTGCRRIKVELGGLPATLYSSEQEGVSQAGILATVRTTANTAVSSNAALASTVTSVQASLATTQGQLAAVEDSAEASASAITGLSARRTLKTTVRSDGKEMVAAIQLGSSAEQSEILLFAEKLTAVLGTDPNGPTQTLFTTGLVNGAAALILRAAWIGDAVIQTLNLADDAISTAYGNFTAGPVNTGSNAG